MDRPELLGLALLSLWTLAAPALAQPCIPSFDPTFGAPGMDSTVFALQPFDSGTGIRLYAGGDFSLAGGNSADRLASFDGSSWSEVGGGIDGGRVQSLAVFDGQLIAGGQFNSAGGTAAGRIAAWDGTSWDSLSGGVSGAIVSSLTVFEDALYAGGSFTSAGGISASNVARFDGVAWSEVGGGLNGSVYALCVHDDGSGPALYAGGFFFGIGPHVAKLDGGTWSAVGGGTNNTVWALISHEGDLYAGGDFTQAGGGPAGYVARWDGSEWHDAGNGINATIWTFERFDGENDGSLELYAGGAFQQLDGSIGNHIVTGGIGGWVTVSGAGTNNDVRALTVHDDGSGNALYLGGLFTAAAGEPTEHIARMVDCPGPPTFFRRGDFNGDSGVDVADPIAELEYLFVFDFPPPACLEAADVNDDGTVNIADIVFTLEFLFGFGPEPPPPFVWCGTDSDSDAVDCLTSMGGCP